MSEIHPASAKAHLPGRMEGGRHNPAMRPPEELLQDTQLHRLPAACRRTYARDKTQHREEVSPQGKEGPLEAASGCHPCPGPSFQSREELLPRPVYRCRAQLETEARGLMLDSQRDPRRGVESKPVADYDEGIERERE